MFFIHWYMVDYIDGSAFFDKPFVSEAVKFGEPYTEMQQLIAEVRGIAGNEQKQAVFERLNQTVIDQVPLIPLGHSPNLTVFRSTLKISVQTRFMRTWRILPAIRTRSGLLVPLSR